MKIEFFIEDQYKGLIPEPYSSSKKIPNWYKKTENLNRSKCPIVSSIHNAQEILKKVNIKSCPAINDYLSTGYVIPAWTNFLFREVNGEFYINWENSFTSHYGFHEKKSQFDGMLNEESPDYDRFHKLDSPWHMKTSPGVSCLIVHPFWQREKRFTTVSGIVHSDISPLPVKWFFEVNTNLKETANKIEFDKEFVIQRGTPLIQIIPFFRKEFNSEIKYVDNNFYHKKVIQPSLYATKDWFNKSLYNNFRESLGKLFK
jgi:hypothetical protein